MRVAVIHDWLTGMRGGEYVLEAILDLVPNAEIFTLIHSKGHVSKKIEERVIHTSALQGIPGISKYYRHFLPIMPLLIEQFDLSQFDLILSSSHCVAKGVKKAPHAKHLSYVHAPMRYIWDRFDDYFGSGRASLWVRVAALLVRPFLKAWDKRVSQKDRVDLLVANSQFIKNAMERAYQRNDIQVVYPFADMTRFLAPRIPGNRYLMVGAFAPNKRVDLAIEAFNQLGLPLDIVGSGQDEARLKKIAGPTVVFLGNLSNREIEKLYSTCRAFVFPGEEDFGITPLEAMAAGAPVIAYASGGATETVTSKTGILFKPQTQAALVSALEHLERFGPPSEQDCRARAALFSRENFSKQLGEHLAQLQK